MAAGFAVVVDVVVGFVVVVDVVVGFVVVVDVVVGFVVVVDVVVGFVVVVDVAVGFVVVVDVAVGFVVVVDVVVGFAVVVDVVVGFAVVVDVVVGLAVGVWMDGPVNVGDDDDDEGDVVRVGDTSVPVTAGPVGNAVVAPDVGDGVLGGGVARSLDVPLGIVPGSLLPDVPVESDGNRRQATVKAAMQNRIMDMANSRTAKRFGGRRARDK